MEPGDYNKAIECLESRHPAARQTLQHKLDESFAKRRRQQVPASLNELALVDDVEVERFVRRARMVTYLIKEHNTQIKSLEARFDQLREWGADINSEALSPKRLFEILKLALDEYRLPESARIAYVDNFSTRVIPVLGEGYKLANHMLMQHGVDMRYELKNPDSAKRNEPEEANTQNKNSIENLIRAITENTDMDPRVKELIKSLFLPLTILAIREPDSLSDSHHPGRLLARELSLFGQMDPKLIDQRIDEVTSLVNHVIAEGAKDIRTVAEVGESVWRITQQKTEEKAGTEATSANEHQKIAEAKRRVVLQLREHLVDKLLPDALRPVLLRLVVPWMLIRYVRYGHNSKPWLEAVAYLRVAVDAVQPAQDLNVLSRKSAIRQHLLDTLQERSQKAALPAEDIQAMVNTLKTYFEHAQVWEKQVLSGENHPEPKNPFQASIGVTEKDILDIQAALDKTELQLSKVK